MCYNSWYPSPRNERMSPEKGTFQKSISSCNHHFFRGKLLVLFFPLFYCYLLFMKPYEECFFFSQPQLVLYSRISACHQGRVMIFKVLPFLRALSTPELTALEVWMVCLFLRVKVPSFHWKIFGATSIFVFLASSSALTTMFSIGSSWFFHINYQMVGNSTDLSKQISFHFCW